MRIQPINSEQYIFVIHTKNYAGNFEREMCAYCTGITGDCRVGEKEAVIFSNELPEEEQLFEDALTRVMDEHGCCRPASIWGNDLDCKSVAIFFEEQPTEEQINVINRRAKKFAVIKHPYDETGDKHITITGFSIYKEVTTIELFKLTSPER